MKKIMLLACPLFIITAAKAQFSKGDQYLGGSVGFSTSKQDAGSPNKTTSINFSPSLTWFKSSKKAMGVRLLSGYTKTRTDMGSSFFEQKSYNVGAGVFCQNIFPLGKNFYFTIEKGIDGSYLWSKSENSAFTTNFSKSHGFDISAYIAPGVGYKISNRLLASIYFNDLVSATYQHGKTEGWVGGTITSTSKSNSFNIGSSLGSSLLNNLSLNFAVKL